METGVTLITAITEGVSTLAEGVFSVVTQAMETPALLTIAGIVIGYGVLKFAGSFVPRWRG